MHLFPSQVLSVHGFGTYVENRTIDENGNLSLQGVDALGRTTHTSKSGAITNYSYNERDDVAVILPPGVEDKESPKAYKYEYFGDGMMKRKKIPGQDGWQNYTYYSDNRVHTHTDANGTLTEFIYDEYGREYDVKINGVKRNMTRYYSSGNGKGQVLYECARVMGQNKWIRTKYIYDQYARIYQTRIRNLSGKEDVTTLTYNLADIVTDQNRLHRYDSKTQRFKTKYVHDKGGRVTQTFLTLEPGGTERISKNTYNENTWLTQKILGNNLQSIDYRYNSRGWLTHINDLPENCIIPPNNSGDTGGDGGPHIEGDIIIGFDGNGIANGNGSIVEVNTQINSYINDRLIDAQSYTDGFDVGDPRNTSLSDQVSTSFQGPVNAELLSNQLSNELSQSIQNYDWPRDEVIIKDLFNGVDDVINQYGQEQDNSSSGCMNESGDLFSQRIYYNDLNSDGISVPGGVNQFNGNISRIAYHSADHNAIDIFTYKYDDLDRLEESNHISRIINGAQPDPFIVDQNKYSSSYIYEDALGNISDIIRKGMINPNSANPTFGIIDQIHMNYETNNRLATSTDNSGNDYGHQSTEGLWSYDHDDNGNMISQGSRTIQYNYLNLPKYMSNKDGESMTVLYDASGSKLKKTSPDGVRIYANGVEYLDGNMEAYHHAEGRINYSNGSPTFKYVIRDHLGNTRITFADVNGDGQIDPKASGDELLQENHSYPFGLNIQNSDYADGADPKNSYQYNGKELNEDLGLNWMDYGARWYDPSIARWNAVDPLASDAELVGWSPYAYVWNNPLKFSDPTGMKGEGADDWYKDSDGNIIYNENIRNEAEFKASGIDGEYLGATYKEDGSYYGLFGDCYASCTLDGKLAEKIDQAFIDYAGYIKEVSNETSEAAEQSLTNMDIGIPHNRNPISGSDHNDYYFQYGESSGRYDVYDNPRSMMGGLTYDGNNMVGGGQMTAKSGLPRG